MKKTFVLLIMVGTFVFSGQFEDGKKIFWDKCAVCHTGHIDADKIKKNFFEQNNSVLMLGAPTVNMLAYAIMRGPKHIGDPGDPDMQQIEIEEYLQNILYHPKRENSICDPQIMKFYDIKTPLKEKLSKDEISALAKFFMEYKKRRKKKQKKKDGITLPSIKIENPGVLDAQQILDRAKKEKKNIIIEASTPTCFYCQKMKREVINTEDVQNLLGKGFIFADINVESTRLPFGLDKHYKNVTPSFFVLNSDGKLLSSYPGSLRKNDFVDILKHFAPKDK